MLPRGLQLRSPIVQIIRHASSTPRPATALVQPKNAIRRFPPGTPKPEKKAPAKEKAAAQPEWTKTMVKATYEPSPIFGTVKPTQKEALTKPEIPKKEVEKEKRPLSEDEKRVYMPSDPFLINPVCV